ncbi:MAG: YIP1 family protein [Desulfovibrionaceae bacterium]|nr:YIP1 family protein [Desulfovibrionaceae bacterium]
MRITCPECGFSRDVPDEKVPASTAVATCPKCRHRFRFRHFDDGFDPSAVAHDPPASDTGFAGEAGGGHRARVGLDDMPRFPGQERRFSEPGGAARYDGRQNVATGSRPEAESPRERGRVFPPPSAHWEPSAPAEDVPPASEPLPPSQRASHPAVQDAPARPEHEDERLRVDVAAVAPTRPEPRPDPGQASNGVRDIWARLQAMDDEDAPRPMPPGRSGPPPAANPPRNAADPLVQETSGRDAGQESDGSAGDAPSGAPAPGDTAAARPSIRADHDQSAERDAGPDAGPGVGEPDGDWPGASGGFAPRRPDEAAQGEVPWERPDVYGFFPGLVLTLKSILFQPVEFFESMPPGRGKGKAMVFNLLLSEFLLLVDFLWAILGVRAKLADTGQTDALAAMAGVPGIGFLILLVMVPVFMAAGIFLDAGLTHLLLMLLRGNSKKFEETFRVMCYSAAPTVLSAVPVAGQLLSPVILIWYMTLQAIGLKKVHGAAYSQALAVVLIKWSLYLFLLLGMLHSLSSGG